MNHIQKTVALSAVTLLLAACGGGGGGGSTTAGGGGGGGTTTTTKSATIAFNVISTAKLPATIQIIALNAFLPAGTTVATDTGSHNISSSALTVGFNAPDLAYATYSAAANKVKIGFAKTNSTFRGGEFARLTVTYPSTTTFTANDFSSLNSPSFPLFQAAGDDSVTHSVFDLSSKLQASLGVTFN